jgi:hypothetical protein
MLETNTEREVVLALQAIKNNPKLSGRAVEKIYSISHQKLSRRRRGI